MGRGSIQKRRFRTLSPYGAQFLTQVRSWLGANVPPGAWAEGSVGFSVQPQANLPPQASFSFSPAGPQVGQWITFDASGSADPDGRVVSYAWDFGDGSTATGVRVNKRYNSAGSYTVRLVVTDDRGATDSEAKTVTVGPAPNQPPTARFNFSPASPDPGDIVHFDASGSSDPDGTITSYAWDFGDGTTGNGIAVNHAFPSAGTYSVTLTVRDNAGATDSETKTVQVGTPTTLPGMPEIDQPGIYVWGTDKWYVTVAGSPSWTSEHAFRLEVRTDGAFADLVSDPGISSPGGPVVPPSTNESSPQGGIQIGPSPVPPAADENSHTFTGSITTSQKNLSFRIPNGSWIYFDLQLDIDGDGELDRAASFVYLRQSKVNPPFTPFVVGLPERGRGPLTPNLNFRLGMLFAAGPRRAILFRTDIETLERR